MKIAAVLVFFCGANLSFGMIFDSYTIYHMRCVLSVPNADISEPYEVWYNGVTRKSRVDFYNGVDKLYRQWDDVENKYVYYYITPETNDKYMNKEVCHKTTLSYELSALVINAYLPMKDYGFVGDDYIDGRVTQKWQYVEVLDSKVNARRIYTVWTIDKEDQNHSKYVAPVRYLYEVKEGDRELDKYQHDYLFFESCNVDISDVQLPFGMTCKALENTVYEPIDPLMEFIDPSTEHVRVHSAFEKFKNEHKKHYSNETEHQKRFEVFKNNLRYINSVNRQHRSYKLGINHLADKAEEELHSFLGTMSPMKKHNNPKVLDLEDDDDEIIGGNIANIDTEFDWRDYGAITEVKDQTLMCGSCYAFTTAAAIESAAYIHRGCKHLEELSEQSIIDCTWEKNLGCRGGTYEYSLMWVQKSGIPSKSEYGPYLALEGLCHVQNMTKLVVIKKYEELKKTVKNIKKGIQKRGPLLVSINTSPRSFSFYSSGIYDDQACSKNPMERTHGVVVIGYGQNSKNISYWILKNSYGATWGEKGYMRIKIDDNICGVQNLVYSVGFKKRTKVAMCFNKM